MFDKKYFSSLILAGLLLIFLSGIVCFFGGKERESFRGNEIKEIQIGENIFQVEIAATPEKRKQGLSGREDLCEDCAMLFIFEEKDRHAFWMKEMNFDLDMIWIDQERIVYIVKDVSHEKELELVRPNRAADKVLEIKAGLTDKMGIKVGDKVEF